MANITLSIPDDIHEEMKKMSDVRWSEVARRAIVEKIEMTKQIEKIASKSRLTEKDALEISKKVKAAATKRFLEDYNNSVQKK
ncbi:hypothetical protein J4399_07180 [Candidatus Woesearchaeota archaeon]|nr:hypothetical protein [Candidatus Woesearchaeota archaeon]HIJ14563.1 hypothetical protein [Candidatus Woesearchaeota archaeon]